MKTKVVTVYRYLQNSIGTFGALWLCDVPLCSVYELPWKRNKKNISCIPAGIYTARLVDSPKHGVCYELTDVPGRGNIQFHPANDSEDTLGCLLLGIRHGAVYKPGKPRSIGVVTSVQAFQEFMKLLGGVNKITVNIIAVGNGIK